MKKFYSLTFLGILLFTCFSFQGCIKDNCRRAYHYTIYEPVYKTMAEVRANIKSNSPKPVKNPGKIYMLGQYIFLNDIDRGIHVIDNINPAHPKNIAFIDIPGNLDIAVKGTSLYADFYRDLVTIDISNPENVILKKVNENVFSHRYYPNGFVGTNNGKVIVDWIIRDTMVTQDCSRPDRFWPMRSDVLMLANYSSSGSGSAQAAASPIGMGGSMARFALVHERLYAVSNHTLNVFNISEPMNPLFNKEVNVGWNIETIFPFHDKLFIGSQNGMFIYNISNADAPYQVSQFSHVRSCDPVIADDKYAYVTLRSGTTCQGFTNQLEVLKIDNIANPTLLKTYPMSNPHGLSKQGDLLFICDGTDGLKIYNAADVNNLLLIKKINDIEAYDVIAWNNIALVVAKNGLYQYDFSDANNIRLLSKITVAN